MFWHRAFPQGVVAADDLAGVVAADDSEPHSLASTHSLYNRCRVKPSGQPHLKIFKMCVFIMIFNFLCLPMFFLSFFFLSFFFLSFFMKNKVRRALLDHSINYTFFCARYK